MRKFFGILVLIWCAMSADVSSSTLITGIIAASGVILVLQRLNLITAQPLRLRWNSIPRFVLFYAAELLIANYRMAIDVMRLHPKMDPMFVTLVLDPKLDTDARITLFSNLITLTPGTLAVDILPNPTRMVVHVLAPIGSNEDEILRTLKDDFERRVVEILC